MKIKNLEQLLPIIKAKLPEYLKLKGQKFDGAHVQCINHKAHKNKDLGKLSASLMPGTNNTILKCFTEDTAFDIFHAYAFLENKPIIGEGFFLAVEALCKLFNIPFETEEEYSPKEIEKQRKRELLTKIHTLSLKNLQNGKKYYHQRQLTKDKIIHFKIGFLTLDIIPDELKKQYKQFFKYDLDVLIESPSLVFPIYNEFHQYIGLLLRQCHVEGGKKYLKLFVEDNKHLLYNIQSVTTTDEIYIVEGNIDAIAMYPYTNVVALLTSIASNGALEYLSKKKFKNIYLALDQDLNDKTPSNNGILRSILNMKNIDSHIYIIDLPEKKDPDEYIKEHGFEAFTKLRKIEAIDYLIDRLKREEIKNEDLYNFILGCPNLITKEKYITKVAKELNIGKRSLTKKLDSLENKDSNINLVVYAQEKEYMGELLNDFVNSCWAGDFQGISSGYTLFDKYLGGFENTVYMFAGKPESGKTMSLTNITYKLLMNDDIFIAFYSLDDGAHRAILPKLFSITTGYTVKEIKNAKELLKTREQKQRYMAAAKTYLQLKDRLIIRDGASVRNSMDLERYIQIHKHFADEHNKRLVVMIDNLHKLTCSYKYGSTENSERIAGILSKLPQLYNCPVITTCEVPKSAPDKPSGSDIKESIALWYAARCVGGVYSNVKDGKSNLLWRCGDKMYPIIEIYFSKNQTGDYWHGSLFYKVNLHENKLIECTEEERKILLSGSYLF